MSSKSHTAVCGASSAGAWVWVWGMGLGLARLRFDAPARADFGRWSLGSR